MHQDKLVLECFADTTIVYVLACVSMYICMCACVHVSVCVCVCVHATAVHAHIPIYVRVCVLYMLECLSNRSSL